MTQIVEVLVPTGIPPLVELQSMAPRLESLRGKRVALLNAMFDVTGSFLEELQDWFRIHLPETDTFILEIENSHGDNLPVAERGIVKDTGHLERIKAEADAAIIALGLCASCTQAVAGTAISLETEYGVPAIAVHNSAFKRLTQNMVRTHGMPYLRQAYTPAPVINLTHAELRAYIEGIDPVAGRPFMDVVQDGLTVEVSADELEAALAGIVV